MRFTKTLGGRVLIYTLIINSILLIVLGLVLTGLSDRRLQEELSNSIDKVLTQTNNVLDTYLIDIRTRLVKLVSQSSVIACLSGDKPTYAQSLPYERDMTERLSGIDLFNPVEDVLILGDNGYVFNLNLRKNLLANYDFTACDWYRQAVDVHNGVLVQMLGLHDQTYYNPLTEPSAQKEMTFSLSMAVSNPANYQIIGAAICNLNIHKLSQLLQEGTYDQHGKIALIDHEGVICACSDGSGIGDAMDFLVPDSASAGHFTATSNQEPYLVCYATSSFSGWKLVYSIPTRDIRSYGSPLWAAMLILLVICLLLNTLAALLYMRSIRRPVDRLTQSLAQVNVKNISPVPVRHEYLELELISLKFNELLEHINELIRKDYQNQIELSRFELSALRGQINPHFLFNTLQLLQTEIVYGNVEKSNQIIISLSQLLRYYMTDSPSHVTVAQEIDYLKKYMMLFEGKYEGRLRTQTQVSEDAGHLLIPKLLLQPVVENAIRHAVDQSAVPVMVTVMAQVKDAQLVLTIEDDGCGITPERLQEVREQLMQPVDWMKVGIGLSNVHQRIRTAYGEPYGITIDSDTNGTTITLILPCMEGEEHETSDL